VDDLLPHYERELAFLREHSGAFAKKFPKIAGRLLLSGDVGEDPHVERLIESFALLASRIHKRLDDDFPLFTEAFFEVLYPHYLRPFPSCSIACFELAVSGQQMSVASVVKRGTVLETKPISGLACKFTTSMDLTLAPLKLVSAQFKNGASAPEGTSLPKGATSLLSVRFELTAAQVEWGNVGLQSIRVHLDGEASQVSALREALCGHVKGVFLQDQMYGPWKSLADAMPAPLGFTDDQALLDSDARTQAAYRLLTEFFAFPEKFNFLDLPFDALKIQPGARSITLHYAMAGIRADSDQAGLLETVNDKNLVLFCTPVANVFVQRADPIRVTHQTDSYPVLPDGRRAFAYEVYSIDKVFRLVKTPKGETISEFLPFYSLRHSELLAGEQASVQYWSSRRDDTLAEMSPGYETEISFVDVNFDPTTIQSETISIELKATNRNIPSLISIANLGGDLFLPGGSQASRIRMLRKPTPNMRFERKRGALWRLISHLSLNHLSLSQGGIEAIKEMLRLYDLPRSAANRSMLDGLIDIQYEAVSAYLPGNPFASFVRGTQVKLYVEESGFVGVGLRLFAQVMDQFFGLYVHINSFTQLKVYSATSKEELIVCPRRTGTQQLL
jgi:type VI secretion system protein ImpG